ncbi:MAG: hypothetical protein RSB50_06135 [Cetobacterium sp.]
MAIKITAKFAKVWEAEIKERMVKLKLSTGDKKQDGTWENSNWNAIVVGKQLEEAKEIKKGDTIEIVSGKISNVYNKEKQTNYLNMVIFEFVNGEKETKKETKKEEKKWDTEDEFPF